MAESKNHYIRFVCTYIYVSTYVYPIFVNVKRQQCLSVSKHNSKQHTFFQQKIAIKTTVGHTTVCVFVCCCRCFFASVLHPLFFKRVRVYVPVFFLCLCYLFIFAVSFLFVFPFFHSVPNHLYFFCLPRDVNIPRMSKRAIHSLYRIHMRVCV